MTFVTNSAGGDEKTEVIGIVESIEILVQRSGFSRADLTSLSIPLPVDKLLCLPSSPIRARKIAQKQEVKKICRPSAPLVHMRLVSGNADCSLDKLKHCPPSE
ncbi:MAG: hypothetical protein WCA89_13115, partial [Terracidiphilus sp.]